VAGIPAPATENTMSKSIKAGLEKTGKLINLLTDQEA
jgi:hypothetical protein